MNDNIINQINSGKTFLGIELGSTRIKAVLTNINGIAVAVGTHQWENSYLEGMWTYSIDEIWQGIQSCYTNLADDVNRKYNTHLVNIGAIGISAMMHGYLAFDKDDNLLTPFRTWRNTITGQASEILTNEFRYNIPQRFSISHLYQAVINKESHINDIRFFTTLAGYVHWKLTGNKVLGIGDASGMFPIDDHTKKHNQIMLDRFDNLTAEYNLGWKLKNILPKILFAGENAGAITETGAKLLDLSGKLKSGVPACPPEGDAGTGMVATNSIAKRTCNVSAGTSVFAMIVLEHELKKVHTEIDLVTTPDGNPVAMVHCNNCTSDLNSWVGLFKEFSEIFGTDISTDKLYTTLFNKALEGDSDCGGLLSYNYLSGEHITNFEEGRPIFVRTAESKFNLANFMRTLLYTSLGTLKTGLDILINQENVAVDRILGHGGFFKTKEVGQRIMSAATNTPVSVMETADEGGAWGISILASYMFNKESNQTLESYLNDMIFANSKSHTIYPNEKDVIGFEKFMDIFTKGLDIERSAVENLK